MRHIRRQTLVHQDSLLNSLKEFEKLSESDKIQNLHYHVLDCEHTCVQGSSIKHVSIHLVRSAGSSSSPKTSAVIW